MAKRPTGIEDRLSTCEKALRLLLQVALATSNSSQVEQKEEVSEHYLNLYKFMLQFYDDCYSLNFCVAGNSNGNQTEWSAVQGVIGGVVLNWLRMRGDDLKS